MLQWKPAEKVDGVVVNGYVRSVRAMKTHHFISLTDGSSLAPLQAVVPADHAEGCDFSRLLPDTACLDAGLSRLSCHGLSLMPSAALLSVPQSA